MSGKHQPESRKCPVDYDEKLHKTSAEYRCWYSMWQRVSGIGSARDKRNYADRGIRVCARWKSFAHFLVDMGRKPGKQHQIDRIDNDKGYSPANCRWATNRENSWNRRGLRMLTFKGETFPMAEWARRIGINTASLSERLDKYPLEVALGAPKQRGLKAY